MKLHEGMCCLLAVLRRPAASAQFGSFQTRSPREAVPRKPAPCREHVRAVYCRRWEAYHGRYASFLYLPASWAQLKFGSICSDARQSAPSRIEAANTAPGRMEPDLAVAFLWYRPFRQRFLDCRKNLDLKPQLRGTSIAFKKSPCGKFSLAWHSTMGSCESPMPAHVLQAFHG